MDHHLLDKDPLTEIQQSLTEFLHTHDIKTIDSNLIYLIDSFTFKDFISKIYFLNNQHNLFQLFIFHIQNNCTEKNHKERIIKTSIQNFLLCDTNKLEQNIDFLLTIPLIDKYLIKNLLLANLNKFIHDNKYLNYIFNNFEIQYIDFNQLSHYLFSYSLPNLHDCLLNFISNDNNKLLEKKLIYFIILKNACHYNCEYILEKIILTHNFDNIKSLEFLINEISFEQLQNKIQFLFNNRKLLENLSSSIAINDVENQLSKI